MITPGTWKFLLGLAVGSIAACTPRYSTNPIKFQEVSLSRPEVMLTVGPGDVFNVRVYGEPDLSGTFRAGGGGEIRFPLIGLVQVGGLTATQIEDRIRKRLEAGYLRNPQVTVFVQKFSSKKIFVFGEVRKPGTFPFEANMSIVQAITLAGGFTKTAWRNRTNVTRMVKGREKKIRIPVEAIGEGTQQNFALLPGDIVFVPQSPL